MRQKGQGIIEFAIVLPLFLLFLFGIIYSGMLFYDHATLSNIARASAREAAITAVPSVNGRYAEIEGYYKGKMDMLLTTLYLPRTEEMLTITEDTDRMVHSEIIMDRNPDSSVLMRIILPDTYTIHYQMRKEP